MEEKITDSGTIRKKTLHSFIWFILFLAALIFIWFWIHRQPLEDGAYRPLRTILNMNERIFAAIISDSHKAKTFSKQEIVPKTKVNGDDGMGSDFNPEAWKLQVVRKPGDTLFISLDEIKMLPKTEIIFDFKCIEGWSQVTHWGGVKFSDFINKYGLNEQSQFNYIGLNTPDKGYYVGIDNKSMLHPQTLLCYEMNNEPLPMNQGYPLRLIIPVKYGIKHLKRIGTIYFSNQRPPDYWYEKGYDYFSGL